MDTRLKNTYSQFIDYVYSYSITYYYTHTAIIAIQRGIVKEREREIKLIAIGSQFTCVALTVPSLVKCNYG